MSRSAFNDLGDVDAVISRYVLVSHPSGDAETQSWEKKAVREAEEAGVNPEQIC